MAQPKVWKGIVMGAVGELVASWTMNQFQKVWTAASEEITGGKPQKMSNSEAEDPTMKTADAISKKVQSSKQFSCKRHTLRLMQARMRA